MFKIGELIKWYEVYGDVNITKDWGYGIVLNIFHTEYGFKTGLVESYKVYRNKHKDSVLFEKEFLEKV